MNHARNPNTRINIVLTTTNNSRAEKVEVISTRAIQSNEALSFNYNTTEYLMAEPFVDWMTGEKVGGFSVLSGDEQKRLLDAGLVAPHVYELDLMAKKQKESEAKF